MDNIISDLKNYVKFLENSNKILDEEIASISSESLKSAKYDSLKNEVDNLHKTLEKFIKGKEIFNLVISS